MPTESATSKVVWPFDLIYHKRWIWKVGNVDTEDNFAHTWSATIEKKIKTDCNQSKSYQLKSQMILLLLNTKVLFKYRQSAQKYANHSLRNNTTLLNCLSILMKAFIQSKPFLSCHKIYYLRGLKKILWCPSVQFYSPWTSFQYQTKYADNTCIQRSHNSFYAANLLRKIQKKIYVEDWEWYELYVAHIHVGESNESNRNISDNFAMYNALLHFVVDFVEVI